MGLSSKERSRLLKLIVLKYVSQSVRLEYTKMSREASTLFLDALDSMIQRHHMESVHFALSGGAITTRSGIDWSCTSKSNADPSCPITCLMKNNSKEHIYQETVDIIKGMISKWGVPTSTLLSPQNPFFLMMLNKQTEKAYEEMKRRQSEGKELQEMHTSTVLATKTTTSSFKWENLSPILVGDLKLFRSCEGKVLNGTLVAVPSVVKGITTFLQDDNGVVVQIGLYNFCPGKMSRLKATEYVRKHLPTGTQVSIAEPFTKIFSDGNRGIRIDDPKEFRIEGAEQSDIETSRQIGNDLFRQQMYHAASESYITGLQTEKMVPILLSNRAQAHIELEQWTEALADAAASLTIRPDDSKTYSRYTMALERILEGQPKKGKALKLALDPTVWNKEQGSSKNLGTAEDLKQIGNEAYKCQDYERAVSMYTSALNVSNKNVRVVLSNWSQSALQYTSYHEALAASAAALRIWADDKAVYRLCVALANLNELNLAASILDSYNGSDKTLGELKSSLSHVSENLANDMNHYGSSVWKIPSSKFCPDFASKKIETFLHPTKGRGIRATADIPKGSMILIETPLATSSTDGIEDKMFSLTLGPGHKAYNETQTLLHSTLLQQMKRNQLLTQRLGLLYDGQASCPLLRIQDLLTSIEVANTPLLLPPWIEFFSEDMLTLSTESVRSILSLNSFLDCDESKLSVSIHAAISMYNHSFEPNCEILPYTDSSKAVVTTKVVQKGDELCISYHDDPSVVKEKWGIE